VAEVAAGQPLAVAVVVVVALVQHPLLETMVRQIRVGVLVGFMEMQLGHLAARV